MKILNDSYNKQNNTNSSEKVSTTSKTTTVITDNDLKTMAVSTTEYIKYSSKEKSNLNSNKWF